MMTIEQIITALDARVLRGHDKLDQNIYCACVRSDERCFGFC